jgi:tetratricopeptide (TPR) repeat protein
MPSTAPRLAGRLLRVVAGSALAALAGCRSATDIQRDQAQALRPASVAGGAEVQAAGVRVLRARLHADDGYRARVLRWRERIAAQLERANRLLEAQFGIRLAVVSVEPWSHADDASRLEASLEALVAADPGDDVDWVIGFVPSADALPLADGNLGVAVPFGRHVVLRAMGSAVEADGIERSFDRLSQAERDALRRELLLHREDAVLLHEWAHTLGALHERSPDALMSPRYGRRLARFSAESAELVRLGLAHRDSADPGERSAWAAAYEAAVERSGQAWDADTREQALAAARRFFGAAWFGAPPAPAGAPGRAACLSEARRTPLADATRDACRAAVAPGEGPDALLALADELVGLRAGPAAVTVMALAEPALEARRTPPSTWLRLAQLQARADACGAAERSLLRAGGHPAAAVVQHDCARLRARVGLPAGAAALPPEREPVYVAAMEEALHLLGQGHHDRALERVRRLERDFPGAGGPALVACAVRDEQKRRREARQACLAAAAAAPGSPRPLLALGEVAIAERRYSDAAEHLRRALELDGSTGLAWSRLALAYQRLPDRPALEALQARYLERFGMPLRVPRR